MALPDFTKYREGVHSVVPSFLGSFGQPSRWTFDADQDEVFLFRGQAAEVSVSQGFHPRAIEDDIPYGCRCPSLSWYANPFPWVLLFVCTKVYKVFAG